MATVPLIPQSTLRVQLDADRQRFSLYDGQEYIGFLGYEFNDGVWDLQHTIIKEEFSRRGYARALVAIVLERIWGREERIIPTCSYIAAFLDRFPQYAVLLAPPAVEGSPLPDAGGQEGAEARRGRHSA